MHPFSLSDLSLTLCQLHAGHGGAVAGRLTGSLGLGSGAPKGWGPTSSSDSHGLPCTGLRVREGCCRGHVSLGVEGGLLPPTRAPGQGLLAQLWIPEPPHCGPQLPLTSSGHGERGYRVVFGAPARSACLRWGLCGDRERKIDH